MFFRPNIASVLIGLLTLAAVSSSARAYDPSQGGSAPRIINLTVQNAGNGGIRVVGEVENGGNEEGMIVQISGIVTGTTIVDATGTFVLEATIGVNEQGVIQATTTDLETGLQGVGLALVY